MTALTEILSGNLINAFGWTLLHSLWQGALIAIVIGVIMIFLKKSSSRLHYLIYNVGLLLIFSSSLVTFLNYYNPGELALEVNAAEEVSDINPALVILTDAFLTTTDESAIIKSWNSFSEYFSRNVPLLVGIWFIGMMIFLLKFLGGLAYTRRLKHYRTVELSSSWENRFQKIAGNMGIKRSVRFVQSYAVKVPVVVSYLKPVVIIPIGMIGQMPVNQVEAVISHELAHIYRKDYLVNLIQTVIEIIFFYHPAVWWLSSNIREERENICDDMAVAYCGDSIMYAKALASVQVLKMNMNILAPAFSNRKNVLLNRIQRMMKTPRLTPNYTEGFVSAVVIFLSIAAISATAAISFNNKDKDLLDPFSPVVASDQIQQMNDNITPVEDNAEFSQIITLPDTVVKEKKVTIKKVVDGKKVKIETINDKIVDVEVDGKDVPEDQFEEYEEIESDEPVQFLIQESLEDLKVEQEFELQQIQQRTKELQMMIKKMQEQDPEGEAEIEEMMVKNQEILKKMELLIDEMNESELEKLLQAEEMMKLYQVPEPDEIDEVFFRTPHVYKYYNAQKPMTGYFVSPDSLNWNHNIIFTDSVFEDNFEWNAENFGDEYRKAFQYRFYPRDVIVDSDSNYEKVFQEYISKVEQYQDQLDYLDEVYPDKSYRYVYNYDFDSKTDRIVRKELQKDGLISDSGTDYVIKLDNKNMYVNGEKQSKSNYKKYRKLIESVKDNDEENNFSYKLIL